MRRYQMWLAAGVLAVGPGLTLAGPLSFLKPAPKPDQGMVVRGQNPNDEKAREVARAIRRAQVGSKVQVAYQNGVAVLMGPVASPQEAMAVLRAADGVEGVQRIENKLKIPTAAPPQQQRSQNSPTNQRRQAALMQTAFQDQGQVPGPAPAPVDNQAGNQPMPNGPMPAGPMPAGPMPAGMPGQPYCPPGMGGPGQYPGPMPHGLPSHHVYDQAALPNYAWPSYAAYPNSAAVSYPQQYSASAWPYIGPFYPYPQVPLGWRKVQLEWDDGYWQLNFRPRTDRWWWFLDYKNW